MTKATRYDISNDCDGESGRCFARMTPSELGDYVEWTDYAALTARIASLEQALRTIWEHTDDSVAHGIADIALEQGDS